MTLVDGLVRADRFGTLHVRIEGRGAPVLLLHGISTSSEAFASQFAGLADDFRLAAWDAPGYGRSGDAARTLELDDYADAAAAVLDALEEASGHVVGASWGGLVATRMALRHPERLRTLTLIASTPGRAGDDAAAEGLRQRAGSLEHDPIEDWVRGRVGSLLGPAAPKRLRRSVEGIMRASVRPGGFAQAAATLAATDHRDRLREIRAPTLAVVGDQDGVTGVEDSRVLVEGIPGARLQVVADAGHLVQLEQPDVVNAALRHHWAVDHSGGAR